MEVFDDYIVRKIHEVSHYKTFVSLIMTSKRFYNVNKDLIPVKRKRSLKFICVSIDDCRRTYTQKFYVLPNDNIEGLYEEFYEGGNICIRCHYINDSKEGLYEEFREDGSVSVRCYYVNNKREGLHESFHEDGSLHRRSHYVNDKKEGLYEVFYEDGDFFERGYYINDELHSRETFFYEGESVTIIIEQ